MHRIVLVLCAVACLAGRMTGQTFAGNLTGMVTDPNQAAIAGADVVLTNVNTGEVRKLVSNETGMYTFSQLLPRNYSLAVTKQGFREHRRTGIELSTSQTVRVEATGAGTGQRIRGGDRSGASGGQSCLTRADKEEIIWAFAKVLAAGREEGVKK